MGHIRKILCITEERSVLVGASCDSCGLPLTPLSQMEDGKVLGDNFQRCLRVSVSGGYGEYIDGGGSVILCAQCALRLERVPSLTKAFKEAREL